MAIALDLTTTHRPVGGLFIYEKDAWVPDELKWRMKKWQPQSRLGAIVKDCLGYLPPDLAAELIERITQSVVIESSLALTVMRHPDSPFRHGGPLTEELGIVSRKKVTTAGVTALCVAWANALFDMKYMALGTSTAAEANTDTALTEITTNHYTGSVRVTCTHAESSNTVPIVGTHTQATAGDTIQEHGIFSVNTPASGTLWDRHLTGAIALAVSDGLSGTYTLTASAEA